MRIDGKTIAQTILKKLENDARTIKNKRATPYLAIVLVGNDPASLSYVKQKQKTGEGIGIQTILYHLSEDTSIQQLKTLVNRLNKDHRVHGIIIQRPVLIPIPNSTLDNLVTPEKDVDGFHPDSPFIPPIGEAVLKILEWVYRNLNSELRIQNSEFFQWLKKQNILIIGRGETGGKPIAQTLEKGRVGYTMANSKTTNLPELCKSSNIIISCVGKRLATETSSHTSQNGGYILRRHMINKDTILVGVGMRKENGTFVGDYDEADIRNVASYYTPVPGGVGPVNVACLLENLIRAAENSLH